MKTRIMQQENPKGKGVYQHLERPGYNKTLCGNRYTDDWGHTHDFILGEDSLDDHISCSTCRNIAMSCLKRKSDKNRWVAAKNPYPDEFREWGKDLSSRATWAINNILVWKLQVATNESVKALTIDEVKTLLKNAMEQNLMSSNLTRINNVGEKTAKEISLWLGLGYKPPKSKLDQRMEKALQKCIQVMMEQGVPSIAFQEAIKEWKDKKVRNL